MFSFVEEVGSVYQHQHESGEYRHHDEHNSCVLLPFVYSAQIVLAEDVYLVAVVSVAVIVFMFWHRMRVLIVSQIKKRV